MTSTPFIRSVTDAHEQICNAPKTSGICQIAHSYIMAQMPMLTSPTAVVRLLTEQTDMTNVPERLWEDKTWDFHTMVKLAAARITVIVCLAEQIQQAHSEAAQDDDEDPEDDEPYAYGLPVWRDPRVTPTEKDADSAGCIFVHDGVNVTRQKWNAALVHDDINAILQEGDATRMGSTRKQMRAWAPGKLEVAPLPPDMEAKWKAFVRFMQRLGKDPATLNLGVGSDWHAFSAPDEPEVVPPEPPPAFPTRLKLAMRVLREYFAREDMCKNLVPQATEGHLYATNAPGYNGTFANVITAHKFDMFITEVVQAWAGEFKAEAERRSK